MQTSQRFMNVLAAAAACLLVGLVWGLMHRSSVSAQTVALLNRLMLGAWAAAAVFGIASWLTRRGASSLLNLSLVVGMGGLLAGALGTGYGWDHGFGEDTDSLLRGVSAAFLAISFATWRLSDWDAMPRAARPE